MNAAMPMFRNFLLSAVRRFAAGRRAETAATPFAKAKPLQNSRLSGLMAALSLLYVVSPVDFLPDIIPVIGWLDDGVILWFGLSQAWKAFRGNSATAASAPNVIETTSTRVR